MKPRSKELGRHVEAVLKALDVLDCFLVQPASTLKELTERTGLNRSRIIRLVGTLESKGYLTFDTESGRYRLGSRIMTLGKVFELNSSLIILARPVLKDLVRRTGEMASLYVLDGFERVAIAREKGIHPIGYTLMEGERMEVYAGGAGKILLTHAPAEITHHVIKKEFLKRLTPKTITNPKQLKSELALIRHQGYAVSEGERAEDAASVAAPVFDYQNKVCAAMGIAGPGSRFGEALMKKYIKIVCDAAGDLSRRLGCLNA